MREGAGAGQLESHQQVESAHSSSSRHHLLIRTFEGAGCYFSGQILEQEREGKNGGKKREGCSVNMISMVPCNHVM